MGEKKQSLSILYPSFINNEEYHFMSNTTWHDLGMDLIIKEISHEEREQIILRNVMMNLTKNPETATFRREVFEDILSQPELRKNIINLLKQIDELQEYMNKKNSVSDTDGIWTLVRRLKEVKEYILCIEQLGQCLSKAKLHSTALRTLRDYVVSIEDARDFASLKKDIDAVHLDLKKVKSITLGVNLGDYYDAVSVGIVSLNDKPFSRAGILSNFTKRFTKGDQIHSGNDWNHNYTYQEVAEGSKISIGNGSGIKGIVMGVNPLMGLTMMAANGQNASGMSGIAENTREVNLVEYLNDVAGSLLSSSVKRLKEVLSQYATVDIRSITGLIPEFLYYILWAEYIEQMRKKGYHFSSAETMASESYIMESGSTSISSQDSALSLQNSALSLQDSVEASRESNHIKMKASNIYNMKLAALSEAKADEIVGNDLIFDDEKCIYILTGANRGGKTTITQAIGQLYVMAQGGIYIPGDGFIFEPVDGIYTHFPADEDKTMDFGRLGEECNRFRDIYTQSTSDSLILLNETFSTTSFEEGYYIAKDAIRAMLQKGVRCIYNTHMHKLAFDVEEMNSDSPIYKAASLIVKTENGSRSYKVEVAPAQGISLAMDIAKKYGVTFEQLVSEH